MNVVIATDLYYPTLGGICVATDQLAHQLAKRGHHVSLIAPSVSFKSHQEPISPHFTIYRIGSFMLVRKKGIRYAFDRNAVRSTIESVKPDIIHIMTTGPGVIGPTCLKIAKKKNIPVVATSHVIAENIVAPLHHLPNFIENNLGIIAMKYLKNFYQRADHMIAPSGAAAEHLRKLGISGPITVISNGLYLDKFINSDSSVLEGLKNRLNLSENSPVILYVGRFDKEKGVDLLFKAFLKLQSTSDAQLLLVGKGIEEERLRKFVEKNHLSKSIIFAGFLSDDEMPAIYHLSDIFVMPSNVELQSIATLEAMAVKLPVVGANAMALPYLIHDGENGFLFKPNDSSDLENKLQILVSDPELRIKMGQRSFDYVQEHAMEHVILKFEALYQSLIAKNASQAHIA